MRQLLYKNQDCYPDRYANSVCHEAILAIDLTSQSGLGQASADGSGHAGHGHGSGIVTLRAVRERNLNHDDERVR